MPPADRPQTVAGNGMSREPGCGEKGEKGGERGKEGEEEEE